MKTDYIKLLSMCLNFVLAVLLFRCCSVNPCEDLEVIKVDTVWLTQTAEINEVPKHTAVSVKEKKVKRYLGSKGIKDSFVSVHGENGEGANLQSMIRDLDPETTLGTPPPPCDSLRFYDLDTVIGLSNIQLRDTVLGLILGRSLKIEIKYPEVTKTVLKKERWKFYAGAAVTVPNDLRNWGIGVSGAMAVPKVGQVVYYYDFRNQSHNVSLMPLIRFKK